MNRTLIVVTLVALACGSALATGAFTAGDEIDPGNETGVYLSPTESSNAEAYTELDDQLTITVDHINAESRTVVDDLFVVGFAGREGTEESASVWFQHDGGDVVTVYRMDTREPVEDEMAAIELDPGESVALGVTIDAADVGTVLDTMTVRAQIPDAQPASSPGSPSDPTSETDPTPTPTPTPDPTPDPTPTQTSTPDPTPTPTSTPDPTPTPTPDTDPTPTPTPSTEPTPDMEPTPTPESPPIGEPVPGLGGLPFDFGSFVVAWYWWTLFTATATVVVDYAVQTRLRRVVPLFESPSPIRSQRAKYALVRLGLLWLTVLVAATVALGLLSAVGVAGAPLFLSIVGGSVVAGAVLGYWRVPDIDADHLESDLANE